MAEQFVKIQHRNGKKFDARKVVSPYDKIPKNFDGMVIAIGFPRSLRTRNSAKYPNGTSVVDVAIWNNFGTDTIPSRPFMQKSKPEIILNTKKMRLDLMRKVRAGQIGAMKAADQIGAIAASVVQRVITRFNNPPNAPSTIKAKGVDNPLIDTGLMRKSVTWEVRNKT